MSDDQDVILVDERDNPVGEAGKMDAHQDGGKLHRAFSIFVFNTKGEMMLQRRALTKYHAPGIWANTTCSHPFPGEAVSTAAHRRLREEMGFDCELKEMFAFTYKADVGNGLTEHEFDHVFFGHYDDAPKLNPKEVADWKWVGTAELEKSVKKNPEQYGPWFRIVLDRVLAERAKVQVNQKPKTQHRF